jgi:TATA-box binding protein (TBP) (component of TFIID and TFIIIB)
MKFNFKIKLSNVKGSWRLHPKLNLCIDENYQLDYFARYNRIIKSSNFTITIYHNSPHVIHLTGIRNMDESLSAGVEVISKMSGYTHSFLRRNFRCDNITATFKFYKKPIDLISFFENVKQCSSVNIQFDPSKFPGFTVRTAIGTGVIFQTGAINILGCKSISQVYSTAILLTDLLIQYSN